jgi:5-methyltetrahydropteroyltriglutamate--homocysteine methyltransferase
MILTGNIGFPTIGPHRELKTVVEGVWRGEKNSDEMIKETEELLLMRTTLQREKAIDFIPCGDFSLYDRMLDLAISFNCIPKRFKDIKENLYFSLARGTKNIPPLKMVKWFNTNYHYIVPEIEKNQNLELKESAVLKDFLFLKKEGFSCIPAIIGPFTFLKLSNIEEPLTVLAEKIIPLYSSLLEKLKEAGAEWISLEEPALVLDITEQEIKTVKKMYEKIKHSKSIILQTYFEDISFYNEIIKLPVGGIGLDVINGKENINNLMKYFPKDKLLSLGVINGRNVWKANIKKTVDIVKKIIEKTNPSMCILQPSTSLMFVPWSLEEEKSMPSETKQLLAFAVEKLDELSIIKKAIVEGKIEQDEIGFAGIKKENIKNRIINLKESNFQRSLPYKERRKKQQRTLNLPLFPTTTIGSFPQDKILRKTRKMYKDNLITEEEYKSFIRKKIAHVIGIQEGLGLDVFVHGEFERSDMVEYFGERLEGMISTENGWVLSYGTRCIRPPVIFGDIERTKSLTKEEIVFAQSLTEKPVKGMLTGAVTILNWSFSREDISRYEIAYQLALALRDEIKELEENGIKIIQVDEPAFREGLPLKKERREEYLSWATKAFRLATSAVKAETQIHTHMCYSEFGDIIEAIDALDADVISIEATRSKGEIIHAFENSNYEREIGFGVYDIHSPRIPSQDEMLKIANRALRILKKEQIWINPDCGLKTRNWKEIIPSLRNLVQVASTLRER